MIRQSIFIVYLAKKEMNKKMSKAEAREKIEGFFSDVDNKKPEAVRKIKKLAMSYNIKLGEKRKLFCKKCYTFFSYKKSSIRINKNMKTIRCSVCGHENRWKTNKLD